MAYQRQNWQGNDSGILRKKEENEEELLVFGYSCKLFRDDEKALYIDQGKHLIPWMGDEALKVDRYDVRGALYDLSQYEAISGQQEELFWINLSSEERRIEQLCDEERYRALTHNEDEERLYQEEEIKRLHQALGTDKTYGQVSYSYDDENGETAKQVADNQVEEADEPYVPRPELDLPLDMLVPETVKLNAIIEKTAMFINQQGLQMEIILKMKQANNPQFDFLSYKSPLHAYYRHVLGAIKGGRYKPILPTSNETDKTNDESLQADQSYYLHHTLSQMPTSSVDVAPVIPSINYKPSADCAYSMLVNKIKNNQNKMGLLSKTIDVTTESETSEMVVEQDDKVPDIVGSPKMYNRQEMCDNNTDDVGTDVKPSSPIVLPSQRSKRKRRKRQQGAFAYNDTADKDSIDGTEFHEMVAEEVPQERLVAVEEQYEIPSADLQLIIDKMACYVGKNGRDFEEIVKSKGDPRFSFLDFSNPYHTYYRKQVEFFEQSKKPIDNVKVESKVENFVEEEKCVNNGDAIKISRSVSKQSAAHKPNPVSFSIKRPKETESLEIKSALPVEESTDEENENEDGNDNVEVEGVEQNNVVEVKNAVNPRVNLVKEEERLKEKLKEERLKEKLKEERLKEKLKEERLKEKLKEERLKEKLKEERLKEKLKEERLKEKLKEERLKEKLKEQRLKEKVKEEQVTEKLNPKEKEKQLQLERKKRAAAFLNLIQKSNKPPENAEVMIGPQLPEEMKEDKSESPSGNEEDENSDSPSSPPSSVTSPDVTIIGETTLVVDSPKRQTSPTHSRTKRRKYSTPEKYRRIRDRDGVEYKHKHQKRKASRSQVRKHSHTERPRLHRPSKESKPHKHHRQHRKEHYRNSERDYSNSGCVHRRHKHYKLKKHKRKEDKKYASSKSNSSGDSDSS